MLGFRRLAHPVAVGLVMVLPVTCSDATVVAPGDPPSYDGVAPLCQVGCVETDPAPRAPGVFLGSGVEPFACVEGGYTDADADGLGEFCERNLAAAFAPELYYYQFDNTGREPYWAARPSINGNVVIAYVLSYYRDEGSPAHICDLPPPFHHPSCEGHNGDSEDIYLEVYYNEVTQHWVLDRAWYSQHGDYGVYGRGVDEEYPRLVYPSHPGAYPRAYVSQASMPTTRD